MRATEERVISAFIAGKPCTMGNTRTDGSQLFLFGNLIAEAFEPMPLIRHYRVTMAGWGTTTTRSRLNALCQLLKMYRGCGFYRREGQWYFNGREIGTREWIEL